MEKEKQVYEKPQLRKVRLDVKASVLAVCHSSLAPAAETPGGCLSIPLCYSNS